MLLMNPRVPLYIFAVLATAFPVTRPETLAWNLGSLQNRHDTREESARKTQAAPAPVRAGAAGGPYSHKILSASSRDGLNWTRDEGVRIEHASVPCAVADGDRILLYYVDADRGRGLPESVGCASSPDGIHFEKQAFTIENLPAFKAVDPSVLKDADGKFRLYYFASDAGGDPARQAAEHEIHMALSDDGIRFREAGVAFRYPSLVDPDVFVFQNTWFMYVFGAGNTVIATGKDGRDFRYLQELDLRGYGTVAPLLKEAGTLRLYAFEQRKPERNEIHSFLSSDGIRWTREDGVRLIANAGEQITDPYVIRWKNGYKMFFKVQERPAPNAGPVPGAPGAGRGTPLPGAAQPFDSQGRPNRNQPGPWDNDVLIFRVTRDGRPERLGTFARAGVPTAARLKDGRLIAAHQHFPERDDANFDKVAVHFSSDEGRTWTAAQVIQIDGLPEGMRFPFDPTLLPLPDGRIRLYFTSLRGRRFEEDRPAIYSAISENGIHYRFEPDVRFGLEGRPVIDCAVVLHQGVFHLFAPDNGAGAPPGVPGAGSRPPEERPREGMGYHATSRDGLNFTRQPDVRIDGRRRWLGNAQSDGEVMRFFGTGGPGEPGQPGGVWIGESRDGASWIVSTGFASVSGADPGAVQLKDGSWLLAVTGQPRPGTPGAQRQAAIVPDRPAAGDGPWNHRVLLARSKDGLAWTATGETIAEQASVPELFAGPDGQPILLYVDASPGARPGVLGAAVRRANGAWEKRGCNLWGADPNVVALADKSYRAYTKDRDGGIQAFRSSDGLNWQLIGEAFRDPSYPQATDPDVFQTKNGWVMLLSLGPRLLRCTSPDGLKFTAGAIMDLGGSVSDTVGIADGWRTFFHVNADPRTGSKMRIRSAFTADGRTWKVEDGDRVVAPADGPARLGAADPAPLQLQDGTWLMALKSFREPPQFR
jgi:hypothetical protein